MVWFSLTLLVIAAFLAVIARRITVRGLRFSMWLVCAAFLLGASAAMAKAALVSVPAGSIGIPVLFGRIAGSHLEEGLHVVNPFTQVVTMSTRTETYTMSKGTVVEGSGRGSLSFSSYAGEVYIDDPVVAVSKDGAGLTIDATIVYRLAADDAPWVYRHIGSNYLEKIIRPAARTATLEAASRFTMQEAYNLQREQLAAAMEELLTARLHSLLSQYEDFEGSGFIVQQVLVRSVELPEAVAMSIEKKLSAEQETQRMEFELEQTRQEVQRKQIEAEGIALARKTVTSDLNEMTLRWMALEAAEKLATSDNAKVIVWGDKLTLPGLVEQP